MDFNSSGTSEVPRQSRNNLGHVSPKNLQENGNLLYQLLTRLVIMSLEGKPIADGALDKVKDQVGEVSNIYDKYASLLGCVETLLRKPPGSVRAEDLRGNLKTMKIPNDCIDKLENIICGPQRYRVEEYMSRQAFFLKLERFRWRIDITISSSKLSRVLEPSILFEMLLSNQERHTCEVSIPKFHELRYTIASILKEMDTIEKKKMFKKSITNV